MNNATNYNEPSEKLNRDGTVTIAGVRLTDGAYGVLAHACSTAADRERIVKSDLSRLRDTFEDPAHLLAECLRGADEDHARGWREYIVCLCDTLDPRGAPARAASR